LSRVIRTLEPHQISTVDAEHYQERGPLYREGPEEDRPGHSITLSAVINKPDGTVKPSGRETNRRFLMDLTIFQGRI
jgi:hypothetical protein